MGYGDDVDFEAFFREHHRAVYLFARHMVGRAAEAEDITSEVLVKVFLQWQRGRVHNPRAYLRRAVVNQAHSWLRRRQVEQRYLRRQPALADEPEAVHLSDRVADADLLSEALQRLPARQRAAIVLRFYEDLSEAETAEVLGVTVGTVKSQVHRGVAKLRKIVGPHVLAGGEPR